MKPIRVALIPAHCPEEILIDLVHELFLREFFILVVNDGSGAAYDPIFEEVSHDAVVLTQPDAQGRGAAFRLGLSYLQEHFPFAYTLVMMDDDGKYRLNDAEHMCRIAEKNRGTLVLGAREPKGTSLYKRVGTKMASILFRLTTGASVSDTGTSLRAFSGDLTVQLLTLSGEREKYEKQMLRYCARRRIPFAEVRVKVNRPVL